MKKIIILIFIITIGIWFRENRNQKSYKSIEQSTTEQKLETEKKCISTDWNECPEFPWLDLPLNYFSIKNVEWGSAGGDGKEGTIGLYTQVALDSKEVYQSYPKMVTTIKKYSTETVPLTTKKFNNVRKQFQNEENNYDWTLSNVDNNYKEYGQLAVHFLENSQMIEVIDSFDVDADGVKEKILGLNFVGRADGGSYNAAIIKGDKVIFYVSEDESFIVPTDTSNGFYVKWRNPNDGSARCCPIGYLKTRFVYQNGKFIPLYEQEVRYFNVGKKL